MRVVQKICILGTISLNKIFIKICNHPIISWFFCDPPISHEKILWPPVFSWPPYSEETDSPFMMQHFFSKYHGTKVSILSFITIVLFQQSH